LKNSIRTAGQFTSAMVSRMTQPAELETIMENAWNADAFFGCGVYMLINDRGRIVYIGSSEKVGRRVYDHMKPEGERGKYVGRKNFRHVAVHWCLPDERLSLEEAYIKKYQPPMNSVWTSRGRFEIDFDGTRINDQSEEVRL
jgi:predicted GIY-YIG superfamily endonuclease